MIVKLKNTNAFLIKQNKNKKAYFGNRDGLELLIRHEELFDMELKDRCGRTALDLACFQGEAACVRCLVRAGANCRSQDSVDGRTPVHAAAYNNHLECLKALHECDDESSLCGVGDKGGGGCHIKLGNMRDRFGRTPLMYATEQGHLNLFNYLINRLGADVLVCDNKKRSALHRAVFLIFFSFIVSFDLYLPEEIKRHLIAYF